MFESNVAKCHRCQSMQRPTPSDGNTHCLAEPHAPVLISVRAREERCPLGRFEFGAGDAVAWVLSRWPLRVFVRAWKSLTNRECGCRQRQAKLNWVLPAWRR